MEGVRLAAEHESSNAMLRADWCVRRRRGFGVNSEHCRGECDGAFQKHESFHNF
jgi:hypothetical protein